MYKLVVLMLQKTSVLDLLLEKLSDNGIKGATIIKSKGMAQELENVDGLSFFSLIHGSNDQNQKNNYTIFIVLHEDQVETCKRVVKDIIGDLGKPNSGILFTLPIDDIEGLMF